ncbi:hypothetical protein BH18ACI2_BH18ACI2_04130 [soil metagenome]
MLLEFFGRHFSRCRQIARIFTAKKLTAIIFHDGRQLFQLASAAQLFTTSPKAEICSATFALSPTTMIVILSGVMYVCAMR